MTKADDQERTVRQFPNTRACIRRQPNLLLRRSRDHDSLRRSESDRRSR
jgi:hypothetical protein